MASYLKILTAQPSPVGVSAVAAGADGTWSAANYAFCVVAWYGDGDESRILNASGVEFGYSGRISAIAVGATNHVTVTWTAPQRGGKNAPDIHHYAIYRQARTNIGDAYNLSAPGYKVAVTGYADGSIPPWATSAVITAGASLTTDMSATIRNADGDVDSYWIEGDYRASLGPDAQDVTVSDSTAGADDGAKTMTWSDVAFGLGGGNVSRGIYTVVRVEEAVTDGIAGTLNWKKGPLTLAQTSTNTTSTDQGSYHSWGYSGDIISLNPVLHVQPVTRNPVYCGYDGLYSPASYGQSVTFDTLIVTIGVTSCDAWEWNYLLHLMKSARRVEIQDYNDRIGVGIGIAGDGYVGSWYGYITHMDYLGNAGKNRNNAFTITFAVEREVAR